ncbi:MAG: AAA family ATPase [Candidatus Thalassarchaeaceae archaeon]|jgi:cell division control protein 6|nr:AAA family ATPase [Candidatus Thalassarchaeaceae archaeon]HJM29793.1 AAA family ATPase [Candidatus Thalassarchaeaceae archaeon]
MAGYLDRIGAGKVLLDKGPLSYDWIPPHLIGRDVELGDMASLFSQIENHDTSCRAVILGPVGSGKTVLTQRFGEDIQRHLDGRRKIVLAHVNCRNHPTGSQVLQQIALTLDSRHPERGFSTGEIIQTIRRNLHTHESHLLLILDEVDVLVRRDSSDLIYKLLRIDEGQEHTGSISLILVSQDHTLLKYFEPAVISRLGQSNIIELQPYDADTLTGIAGQRAGVACRTGAVSDETLSKIGRFSADVGDARMAIELLDAAIRRAEKAGRGDVLPEDVRPSTLRKASLEPAQVDNLSIHQKLVLLGICRRLKKTNEISSGDAQKLYQLVCEEFAFKPRSYTTFWKHLKALEIEGLIETKTANASAGRGRTQHITMTNTPPATLESRIEKELLRG